MTTGRDQGDEALVALVAARAGQDPGGVVAEETSSGALIAVAGAVAGKLHAPGTDGQALAARLRLARRAGVEAHVLPPLTARPVPVDVGSGPLRWATLWPRVEVVARDPDEVPWSRAAATLAALHRLVPPPWLPPHGAVERLARGVHRLASLPTATPDLERARSTVGRAAEALPPAAWAVGRLGRPTVVVHGDWHLGQVGRMPSSRPRPRPAEAGERSTDAWLLIDLDDLGGGDPAWDFERPAAMWAAGILPDAEWGTFVQSYREAEGPALPGDDPWPVLDPIARAGVVQAAAGAVRRAIEDRRGLDPVDEVLVEVCGRIAAG